MGVLKCLDKRKTVSFPSVLIQGPKKYARAVSTGHAFRWGGEMPEVLEPRTLYAFRTAKLSKHLLNFHDSGV